MDRRRRFVDGRGATLVEYALIISLFVVPSIGALRRLDSNSRDYYANASDDIGDLPQSDIDTSPSSSAVPASTTTTVPVSTTTTAAPTTTTAPPTTTTTMATTTTTAAPTTTTLLRSRIFELTDISSNNGSSYYARARVKIVRSDTGLAVRGASVSIRLVDDRGNATTKSCTTDSTGRCSVTWSRPDSYGPVTATARSVSASPTWDGVQQSTSLGPV